MLHFLKVGINSDKAHCITAHRTKKVVKNRLHRKKNNLKLQTITSADNQVIINTMKTITFASRSKIPFSFIFIAFFANILNINAFSAYLPNLPLELKEPEGREIQGFSTDDELQSRLHYTDNNSIVQVPETTGYQPNEQEGVDAFLPFEKNSKKHNPKQLPLDINPDFSIPKLEPAKNIQNENEADEYIVLKGNVKKNNNLIYCYMAIYSEKDFQIVYFNNVGPPIGNEFKIRIPKGTYSIYLREYNPAPIPIEYKNIKLQNDTTISFNYNPVFPPEKITSIIESINTSKIFLGIRNDSLNLFVKIDNTIPFDTLYYINEARLPTERKSKIKILLKDDGTEGDQVALDGIYTSPYLNGCENHFGASINSAYIFLFELVNYNHQNYFVRADDAAISIPMADPAKIGDMNIKQINDSIFMSDFVLNIVTSDISDENFTKTALLNLYNKGIIRDRFDFVNFFSCEFTNGSPLPNTHETVQQKIEGIGREMFNHSSQYGSNDVLLGISNFPGISSQFPLLHETMHQWSAYLDLFYAPDYGFHWGLSSVDGILGGFDPDGLEIINDSLVKINSDAIAAWGWQNSRGGANADLELYLAGLLPLSELRDSFYVLENPVFIGDNCFNVKGVKFITPQMIVDKYGERLPSYSNSQKTFNFLNIVFTKQPLNEAGYAFFEDQIRLLSNDKHTGSFKEFTNNIGTANTRLKYDITHRIQINSGENYKSYSTDTTFVEQLLAISGCDSIITTILSVNQKPIANAGNDQLVNEGIDISLDGSASFDPDGNTLIYKWTSHDGISLSSTTVAKPTFTAPEVTANTNYTFSLVVNDGTVDSPVIQVVITVQNVNKAPVANAGLDQTVNEGEAVSLNGSASFDPDGNTLIYKWTAPEGITLSSTTTTNPTFTAPEVTANTNYTFSLVVNDGTVDSPMDQVVVTVQNVNKAPVANAGLDQTVNEGEAVSLDGSASSDSDGNTLIYKWTSHDGISLSSTTVAKPTFTAPYVTTDTPYTFSLIVNDGTIDSPIDQVNITVLKGTGSGVNEMDRSDNLKVYPNPTTGLLNVSINELVQNGFTIDIYNCVGRLVKSVTKIDEELNTKIDLSTLTNGIYLIRITTKNQIFQQKIIKE